MKKINDKRKMIGSILLLLFIFNSFSLLFFPQANNDSSKGESIENSEGLNLSAIYMTTTEVVSTESVSHSYDPAIAVDGAGNAHVVWHEFSGADTDILYKQWNATSSTWTTTEVVSTESTGDSGNPAIAVDGTGSVHVAWNDYTDYDGSGANIDIFYKRWNVTSSTWTTTEVVSTESTNYSYDPAIAVDDTGNVYVAWEYYTGSGIDSDIFYKRWNATSSTWTTTEVVSTESTDRSESPTIAVDGVGNIHVAWQDWTNYSGSGTDYDIFYKRWNTTSSTWTTSEVISTESTGFSLYPTITTDDAGNVHVAWHDSTNYDGAGTGLDIFYKYRDITSQIWTTTEVVSTVSTETSQHPTIAVDGAGNVHMAWLDNTIYSDSGADTDIFYKYRDTNSSIWITTEVVSTESTGSSYNPTIAVDDTGKVHVAWEDFTNYGGSGGDNDIFYKRLNYIPEITIISPIQNQFVGIVAPEFEISITEPNFNTTWYTLDNGLINKTFIGLTGTIDQTEWDKKGHGAVTIRFYANDSFGREGFAEVDINKDLNPPTSSLSFIPHGGINEVNISTIFSISANDGLESGVLNIRYQINDSAWTDYTGLFTLSAFPSDDYLISYYAIDNVGNVEVENTLLVKLVEIPVQEPLPDMGIIIITVSVIGGIGVAIAITIILIRKRK